MAAAGGGGPEAGLEVGVLRQGCLSAFSLLNSQATEPAQPSALCKVWHGLFFVCRLL